MSTECASSGICLVASRCARKRDSIDALAKGCLEAVFEFKKKTYQWIGERKHDSERK